VDRLECIMKSRRALLSSLMAIGAAALCLSCFFQQLPIGGGNANNVYYDGKSDKHTIPTLLSVFDEKTGKYIYALENPLYERLQKGVFSHDFYEKRDILDRPTIQVNDDTIDLRGPLTVSWTLGRSANEEAVVDNDDIIILYCGDQVLEPNVSKRTFLDAATINQALATSQKHFHEAFGSAMPYLLGDTDWYFPNFPVVRQDVCQFALFKSLPHNTYSLLALTDLVTIRNGKDSPTAVHLALGDSIDEMVVQFKTDKVGVPVVHYGVDKDSMLLSATGTSKTYKATDMCQEPATKEEPGKFLPPGQLHVVTLTHLDPDRKYYYRVGVLDDETQASTVWSDTFSFVSSPEVKANSDPFSYIVYGDQGCPSVGWGQGGVWTSEMTTREIANNTHNPHPIRAVHHFGDLSYARGAAHIWDEWLNMISSFTAQVPLMIASGNHEYDHSAGGENGKDPSGETTPGGYHPQWGNFGEDSKGECGVPTANHFQMPNTRGNSNGVFWYSFDFANVHTTIISSEHDLSPGSRQYMWLEDDLKSVDRSKTPWLVLELHRPIYESEAIPKEYRVGIEIRHRIEDLLLQYGVDMVLAGHYHSYQRTCAGLYKSKCGHGGPVHIMVGSAGAQLTRNHIDPRFGHWTEKFVNDKWGYGRITVANATALHFEFIQAGSHNDTDAGKVLDETWIIKGANNWAGNDQSITLGDFEYS